MIRSLLPFAHWTWLVSTLPRPKDQHLFLAYYFNIIILFLCPYVWPLFVRNFYFLHNFHCLPSKTISPPLHLLVYQTDNKDGFSHLLFASFSSILCFLCRHCKQEKQTPSNFIFPQLSLTTPREQQLGLLFCMRLSKIPGLLWSWKIFFFDTSVGPESHYIHFMVTTSSVAQFAFLLLCYISLKNYELLGRVCVCHTLNLLHTCLKLENSIN